jgi:simple sugar transport system ATP-binding protein
MTPVGTEGDTPPPALRMRGVTKRYGPVAAVENLDLDIGPGEIVSLVGDRLG